MHGVQLQGLHPHNCQIGRTLRLSKYVSHIASVDSGILRVGGVQGQWHVAKVLVVLNTVSWRDRLAVFEPVDLQWMVASLRHNLSLELDSAQLLVAVDVLQLKVQSLFVFNHSSINFPVI